MSVINIYVIRKNVGTPSRKSNENMSTHFKNKCIKCSNGAIIESVHPMILVQDGCGENGLRYCYLDVISKLHSINKMQTLHKKATIRVAYL